MQMVQACVQASQVVCFDEARIDAASEDQRLRPRGRAPRKWDAGDGARRAWAQCACGTLFARNA